MEELIPRDFLRAEPVDLPEVSELEVVRHYTQLSRLNYAVDVGFTPLGSCTMKYNPRVNEDAASLPGLARLHPLSAGRECAGRTAAHVRTGRIPSRDFGPCPDHAAACGRSTW